MRQAPVASTWYAFVSRISPFEGEETTALIGVLGGNVASVVVIVVGGWIAIKWLQRYLFIVRLRVSRITPDELRARLDGPEPPFVVDLRHKREYEHDPVTVPGAVRMTTEELQERHVEIPRDRDVVLYCT